MINHLFLFALSWLKKKSNRNYLKVGKRWYSLDRRNKTQINCFNSKTLGNCSKSSNIVRL